MIAIGSIPLTSGQQVYNDIPFDVTFPTIPSVAPVVMNSQDLNPFAITAHLTGITTTTFSVELTVAPDTEEYQLVWMAATNASSVGQAGQIMGQLFTDQPFLSRLPLDTDRIPIVSLESGAETRQLTWAQLRTLFPAIVAGVEGPGDGGSQLSVSWSDGGRYLLVRYADSWRRFPAILDHNWAADYQIGPIRRGMVELQEGDLHVTVAFDPPFGGGPDPVIESCTIDATDPTDLVKHLMWCMPVAISLTSVTFRLSGHVPEGQYRLHYRATQAPT